MELWDIIGRAYTPKTCNAYNQSFKLELKYSYVT